MYQEAILYHYIHMTTRLCKIFVQILRLRSKFKSECLVCNLSSFIWHTL
ncbi:unnamed protein product [Musa acuminata subsp. malaccensis]|uniref:(wild Malaysian banana) hypothetical protein n=1 Tax=Musa acuminata subsp. malaccensis TaxID=214687 RepID=A0A804KA85_MUSAM|nr:unnamed protein product [Musa acuminata subsp. malaccensis]